MAMSAGSRNRVHGPAVPDQDEPTLAVPVLRGSDDLIQAILDGEEPASGAESLPTAEPTESQDGGRRSPTPRSFVVPDRPEHNAGTLTIVRGLDAGRVFRLSGMGTVIGRGNQADVLLDDQAVSRHHARITRKHDGQYLIEDLGSTNGTFVEGRRIQRALLFNGCRVQFGPHVSLRFAVLAEDEDTLQRRLYETSILDALTGVLNRHALLARMEESLAEARLTARPLSALMVDLDHFKRVNDTLGHVAGDDLLRAVAAQMLRVVRANDFVGRYGGEEFVVIAKGTTLPEAAALGERVRSAIERLPVPVGARAATTTASVGVASLSECSAPDSETLIRLADERMYLAKRLGRNRVCSD